MSKTSAERSLELIKTQRSHVLFLLSSCNADRQDEFVSWSKNIFSIRLEELSGVISINHFEKHDVDVTEGAYQHIPDDYLSIIELSVDGAEQAEMIIQKIEKLYEAEPSAGVPSTWLYYPVSEKVGRSAMAGEEMLTLAFANPLQGTDQEFREWYCTRHIRHALNVTELVSGQCLELTGYQRPGARQPSYQMIAVYEQEGTPEAMMQSMERLPEDVLDFPALDLINFAEWVYRPMQSIPIAVCS